MDKANTSVLDNSSPQNVDVYKDGFAVAQDGLSADGRYILVYDDFLGSAVKDLRNGHVSFVSAGPGQDANRFFYGGSISADGRYVAFDTQTAGLIPNGSNVDGVFREDMWTGKLSLVSINAEGVPGNGDSLSTSISHDGRYVAFESESSNLIPGLRPDSFGVFVKDTRTGVVRRADTNEQGEGSNGLNSDASISANGRFVVFASDASNLTSDVISGYAWRIYVKDLQTGSVRCASTAHGTDSSGGSSPVISADGRYVAFNGDQGVYVKDLQTGALNIVSIGSYNGLPVQVMGWGSAISPNGRYVEYTGRLGSPDSAWEFPKQVFVADRWTGQTTLISRDDQGNLALGAGKWWDDVQDAFVGSVTDSGLASYATNSSNLATQGGVMDVIVAQLPSKGSDLPKRLLTLTPASAKELVHDLIQGVQAMPAGFSTWGMPEQTVQSMISTFQSALESSFPFSTEAQSLTAK